MNAEDLQRFTAEIAAEFNAGKIRHPVHLSDGNEEQLLAVFEEIEETDWVCGGWRMQYQCLLHGVPPEVLKDAIRNGQSMTLSFPEYNILSSAIVGGILPIATGIALQLKLVDSENRVYCFLGDMTAETGAFHECAKFADFHDLPITWIVEDNGLSVCTPTDEVWGYNGVKDVGDDTIYYTYKSRFPHAGAGIRVQF